MTTAVVAVTVSVSYPRAVLVALVAAVGVVVVVSASTSTAAFGAYNAAWDGASGLREVADDAGAAVELAENATAYRTVGPDATVAFVLSPETPYSEREVERVRSFVRDGGTLVVADDFGEHGNALLAGVGARARVDGRPLRDERHNLDAPAFAVAGNVSSHPLTRNVDAFALNYGSAVDPNGATVLVRSSGYAYLDANRNGTLDDDETIAAHPVASVEAVGDGRVVVVADPSAFINAMLDRRDNRAFVRNLVDGRTTVLLDYSHAGGVPPLVALVAALQGSAPLQLLVAGVCVAAVAAWTRYPDLVARLRGGRDRRSDAADPLDASALREFAARRHPEWDETRIGRVTERITERRDERENDD